MATEIAGQMILKKCVHKIINIGAIPWNITVCVFCILYMSKFSYVDRVFYIPLLKDSFEKRWQYMKIVYFYIYSRLKELSENVSRNSDT